MLTPTPANRLAPPPAACASDRAIEPALISMLPGAVIEPVDARKASTSGEAYALA
jgi:hypothetical protein